MPGREFFKMSGSGNDFVIVDARTEPPGFLGEADTIAAVCARGTGVGADGIVFLERSNRADFRMTYLNSDGSPAALCGNASLCVGNLAVQLGLADAAGFRFETDSGIVSGRIRGGHPEIDFQPPSAVEGAVEVRLEAGERRMGFAVVGVPHLVVLVDDVASVDLARRGPVLRRHPVVGPAGANANFVSRLDGDSRFAIRTFERGVEGETLACGTGAVASAVLLQAWGEAGPETRFQTRSGREVTVRLGGRGATVTPSLSGEGRLVFTGRLSEP